MDYLLPSLNSKEEIDEKIIDVEDKVLVLRFGRAIDPLCMELDHCVRIRLFFLPFFSNFFYLFKLSKCAPLLAKMAQIFTVDVDTVPEYASYFDITLIPSTLFFFNTYHLKCDWG
jgi:hypothetical protein